MSEVQKKASLVQQQTGQGYAGRIDEPENFRGETCLKGTFEDFDGFLRDTFRTVCFTRSCLTTFVSAF